MIGIVVAAHGRLGQELIRTAEEVVGPMLACIAVDLTQLTHHEEARLKLSDAVASVEQGEGVLILTDMFGGTPATLGLALHQEGRVEVLTGVNLPMLLKLATTRHATNLHETARLIKYYGQKNISVASEILTG